MGLLTKTLTKENFFNRMQELYPVAMRRFCDWIDMYKIAVSWGQYFVHSALNGNCLVKYHDLPCAMQLGIFIAFIQDDCTGQDYAIDLMAFNLEDLIEDYFKATNYYE